MQTSTQKILPVMNVVAWIVFIGLCIQTGAIAVSGFVSLFVNPEAARHLPISDDLSALYRYSVRHYVSVLSFIVILSGLKAYLFYQVTRVFSTLNLNHPFSATITTLIDRISYVALEIGVVALLANAHSKWLMKQGAPVYEQWGSAEFLFMAGVIFVVALVFRRGTEIQAENDLTI